MNIVNAIINLVNNPVTQLVNYYQGRNRANNAGDALEEYIKDLFANSFDFPKNKRLERISRVFSYLGIKKIESDMAALALNSSCPKHKVKNPDNPAQLVDAKLIAFSI